MTAATYMAALRVRANRTQPLAQEKIYTNSGACTELIVLYIA